MSWAEIKKAVNSDLGKPLNEVLRQKHVFTESGYIDIPSTISEVFVTAIAAGGDGEDGQRYKTSSESGTSYGRGGDGGKGGDCGEYVINYKMPVVPGKRIRIGVGTGNTVVGDSLVLLKGAGPLKGGIGGIGGLAVNGSPGNPGTKGRDGDSAPDGTRGGIGGSTTAYENMGRYTGGGGGGGGGAGVPKEFVVDSAAPRFGNGASGAPTNADTPTASPALTTFDIYGGGGGGGGGGAKGVGAPSDGSGGGSGAKGAPGIVMIEW